MVWMKGKAKWSGKCKCGKRIEKGDIVYSEVKGFIPLSNPNLRAICEECFKKEHPNEETKSPMGVLFRRMTLRTG